MTDSAQVISRMRKHSTAAVDVGHAAPLVQTAAPVLYVTATQYLMDVVTPDSVQLAGVELIVVNTPPTKQKPSVMTPPVAPVSLSGVNLNE
jgi:hypothetical protein